MIREENSFKSRMSETENELMPKGLEDKNMDNESKVTNEDKWIQPKKCVPLIFLNTQK